MDRTGAKFLVGFSAALLYCCTAAWAVSDKQPLRAMAWLSPEGQFAALTSEPETGFRITRKSLDDGDMILTGEALFNTPTLLGGQAAKAGISCASCHVNGRDNPHFQFPGVSGKPGTADVTHSFFSSYRGDSKFNPVTIPDLTLPGKVSRHNDQDMINFIRDLIVEEFNGAKPSPTALRSLTAYIQALCNDCETKFRPITLGLHVGRVERAITVAEKFHQNEPDLSRLLLAGARHQLGLIYERYSAQNLANERQQLVDISAHISELQKTDSSTFKQYSMRSDAILKKLTDLEAQLFKSSDQSLYNPDMLRAALPN